MSLSTSAVLPPSERPTLSHGSHAVITTLPGNWAEAQTDAEEDHNEWH